MDRKEKARIREREINIAWHRYKEKLWPAWETYKKG